MERSQPVYGFYKGLNAPLLSSSTYTCLLTTTFQKALVNWTLWGQHRQYNVHNYELQNERSLEHEADFQLDDYEHPLPSIESTASCSVNQLAPVYDKHIK